MQFIVDELFVGNKLAAGASRHRTARRSTCATSARRSSCSAPRATTSRRRSRRWTGSSISTSDVDEIRALWTDHRLHVHETVGHLGIFVSGGVARKEHGEFATNIDLIDVLPPGLYEAMFDAKRRATDQSRACERRLGHALRDAHAGRHPRAWAATRRKTNAFCDRRARVRDQPRASTALSRSPGPRRGHAANGGGDAADASAPASLRCCSADDNPLHGVGGEAAEKVRDAPQAGGRRQSVPRAAGERSRSRSSRGWRAGARLAAKRSARRLFLAHLWLAGAAGSPRHRRLEPQPPRKAAKDAAAPRAPERRASPS